MRSARPDGPWPFELSLIDSDENAVLMLGGPFEQDSTVSPADLIAPARCWSTAG